MPFFMRHLFVFEPDTVNYLHPKCQSKWWCASRFSHGNFKYGAFLSAAMSPFSRSAMSIVLLPPQQRITLVK